MISRLCVVFALSVLFSTNSLSQDLASIEGKVLDAKTKEALPGAAVYLANTAIGVPTDINGVFLLDKITSGKYDLTASMLGYKVYSKPFVLEGNAIKGFIIYLTPENIQLGEIEIKAKRQGSSGNDFSTFQKYFLGSTFNASKCKILNRHDILIDNKGTMLVAKSYKPIEIENGALGYRLFYILKEFVIDKANKTVKIVGIPRFENLEPESKKQEAKWIKDRDRTYYGSMEHFIRSLKAKELKKNRFVLYDGGRNVVPEQKLFTKGDSIIRYDGKLQLVFTAESADPTFDPKRGPQESTLSFSGISVRIYNNGNYENFQDIFLTGYLGWSANIAELMPLGYQPASKLK